MKNKLVIVLIAILVIIYSCKQKEDPEVINSYNVFYNDNSATTGTVPVDMKEYHTGDSIKISKNTGNLQLTGYDFVGWNTLPDGTGISYKEDTTILMKKGDLTLYAKWKRKLTFMNIAVESPAFRPAMEFNSAAVVTFVYGDGTKPVEMPVDSGVKLFDKYTFITSDTKHDVKFNVEPWGALKVLNFGFRGGDGGNGQVEMQRSSLPYIEFLPTFTEMPITDGTWDSEKTIVLDYVGKITSITNLRFAYNLEAFCCEFQPITEIDCSGCSNLLTIEAFFSTILKTNFQGCDSLHRCCLESTGARYSWRMVNGIRTETEVLDLSDCVDLRDLRGTGDDHTSVIINPNAVTKLWHFCKMSNTRMTQIQIGTATPEKFDLNKFTGVLEFWVSNSPIIENVLVSNNNTYSMWLNNCGVKTLDIHNQTQINHIEMQNNQLTSINIDGCSGLFIFDLNNCSLTEAMVDYILLTLDEFNITTTNQYNNIDLTGNNAAPSAEGLIHANALMSRGWNVKVNK